MVAEAVGRPGCAGPMLENVDPLTAGAFQAFGRIMRLHKQAILKTMEERGVHHSDAFVLRLLAKREGISQRELSEIIHISAPRATKVLQSLEKSGMIARRVDESDQRRTLVFLTPKGREEEERFRGFLDDYINRSIGALPDVDKRELERMLNEIADRIEVMIRTGGRVES